jgi:hypothetical protein
MCPPKFAQRRLTVISTSLVGYRAGVPAIFAMCRYQPPG